MDLSTVIIIVVAVLWLATWRPRSAPRLAPPLHARDHRRIRFPQPGRVEVRTRRGVGRAGHRPTGRGRTVPADIEARRARCAREFRSSVPRSLGRRGREAGPARDRVESRRPVLLADTVARGPAGRQLNEHAISRSRPSTSVACFGSESEARAFVQRTCLRDARAETRPRPSPGRRS